jgi:hypothetical protein
MLLIINGLFTLLSTGIFGWSVFQDVTFEWEYREEVGAQVQMPVFGPKLTYMDGKQIELSGYYLPMVLNRRQIIISKQPYSSCFFCGGESGPESVAEVHFIEEPPRFKVDEIVHVKGRLRLNPDDFDHLVFILEEAELVE